MTLDTFLAIVCFIGIVVCGIGLRCCSRQTHFKYHEQRVWLNTKKEEQK